MHRKQFCIDNNYAPPLHYVFLRFRSERFSDIGWAASGDSRWNIRHPKCSKHSWNNFSNEERRREEVTFRFTEFQKNFVITFEGEGDH